MSLCFCKSELVLLFCSHSERVYVYRSAVNHFRALKLSSKLYRGNARLFLFIL